MSELEAESGQLTSPRSHSWAGLWPHSPTCQALLRSRDSNTQFLELLPPKSQLLEQGENAARELGTQRKAPAGWEPDGLGSGRPVLWEEERGIIFPFLQSTLLTHCWGQNWVFSIQVTIFLSASKIKIHIRSGIKFICPVSSLLLITKEYEIQKSLRLG